MEEQPDLLTWTNANFPKDTTRTDWFKERICFIYEEIPQLISNSPEQADQIRETIKVIYEHTSDLENVPEVIIKHSCGLEIVLYWQIMEKVWQSNWYVSIKTPKPIQADLYDLLILRGSFRPGLFKGLPFKMTRYPSFDDRSNYFVCYCRNTYRLHTIIWLIGKNLGLRKK